MQFGGHSFTYGTSYLEFCMQTGVVPNWRGLQPCNCCSGGSLSGYALWRPSLLLFIRYQQHRPFLEVGTWMSTVLQLTLEGSKAHSGQNCSGRGYYRFPPVCGVWRDTQWNFEAMPRSVCQIIVTPIDSKLSNPCPFLYAGSGVYH